MSSFVDLIKRAFKLWWQAKILWPLGMLATLVGAGDLSLNGGANVSQSFPTDASNSEAPAWLLDLVDSPLVTDMVANPWPYLFSLVLLIIGVSLVTSLFGALAHGALIRVADVVDRGYQPSFGDALSAGVARMLPLFLVNLILALPVLVVATAFLAMLVGLGVSILQNSSGPSVEQAIASILGAVLCFIVVGFVLGIAGTLLGVFARVAHRACAVEQYGPLASLGRAWVLVRRNLGLTVLTWLLLAAVGSIVGVLVAMPGIVLAIPVMVAAGQSAGPPVGLFVLLLGYFIIANLIVGGIFTAFSSTLWTVVYRFFVTREQALTVGTATLSQPG